MPLPIVPVLALVLSVLAWGLASGRRLPTGFRHRGCQGRFWRRSFPNTPKTRIRIFLQVFADSFAFETRDGLRFSPHDRILTVYRALYPSRWTPDSLELETFAQEIEKRYGLRLKSIWNDQLSLGDVFRAIEAPSNG